MQTGPEPTEYGFKVSPTGVSAPVETMLNAETELLVKFVFCVEWFNT